ncbi:MAG TPA: hypothetical protein PK655_02950 [archaeon]|nr:hypothetical protein [archaeon]
MSKIKTTLKILMILIFIQIVIVPIYAVDCFQNMQNVLQDVEYEGTLASQSNEYFLKLNNSEEIINPNFNFVRISNNEHCNNKKFILWISQNQNFKITENNEKITISGIDEIRFDSGNPNNSITLNFIVDNDEELLVGYSPIPGILSMDVNETKILTNTLINITERQRRALDTDGNVGSPNRVGHGTRLNFQNLIIEKNADLNISLIATKPNDHSTTYSDPIDHGIHGGVAILSAYNIINYGTVDINLFAADGAKGSAGSKGYNKNGGVGGNGGQSVLIIQEGFIKNYGKFNVFLKSGNGANGAKGSGEKGNCGGSPKSGGAGGNGGHSNFIVYNLENLKEDEQQQAEFNITIKSGNGGRGGNGGNNTCGADSANGGKGGYGGHIKFIYIPNTKYNIVNQGILRYDLSAGDGEMGGNKSDGGGKYGESGVGGSISDYNISNFINEKDFYYYALSGKVNVNKNRGQGKAGSIGSINIDKLENLSLNFNITNELNEQNVENINSLFCHCDESCNNQNIDPKIGNININYLKSGSFLPKSLKLIKYVPVKETAININGCHAASSGNSSLSYKTDNLTLRLANLGIIQNDFDSESSKVGRVDVEEINCPVCDSLELNNFALRTDTEYTIYTDNAGVITDLNIYYVNPDGSLFKPPGYPSDENYVVYSLKTGENIMPDSKQFAGTNIKEYKIAKDILHYNPENFDLTNIPEEKGYGIDDVRLFCQAQRYLLKFKLQNDVVIKEIYFTPLFNIK